MSSPTPFSAPIAIPDSAATGSSTADTSATSPSSSASASASSLGLITSTENIAFHGYPDPAFKGTTAQHATTTISATTFSWLTLPTSTSQSSLTSLPSLASPSQSHTASASSSLINTPCSPSTDLPDFTPALSAGNSVVDLLDLCGAEAGADLAKNGASHATTVAGPKLLPTDARRREDRAEGEVLVGSHRMAVRPMTPLRPVLEVAGEPGVENGLSAGEKASSQSESAVGDVEDEEGERGPDADIEDAGENILDDPLSEAESWGSSVTRTPRRQLAHSLFAIPDDAEYGHDAEAQGWSSDEEGWSSDVTRVDEESAKDGDNENEELVESGEEDDNVTWSVGDLLSEEDFAGIDDEQEGGGDVDSACPTGSSPARSLSTSLFVGHSDCFSDSASSDSTDDTEDSRPNSPEEEPDLASLIPVSPWAIQTSSPSSAITYHTPSTSTFTPSSLSPILDSTPQRLALPPRSSPLGIFPSPPPSPQPTPPSPYLQFEATYPTHERFRPVPLRTPVLPLRVRWETVPLEGTSGARRTERDEKADKEAKEDEEWFRREEAKLKAEDEAAARVMRLFGRLGGEYLSVLLRVNA